MLEAPRLFRPTDPDFPLSPAVQKLLRDRGRVMGEAGEVLVYARPARPSPASPVHEEVRHA